MSDDFEHPPLILSPADSEALARALIDPPSPNVALSKALHRYSRMCVKRMLSPKEYDMNPVVKDMPEWVYAAVRKYQEVSSHELDHGDRLALGSALWQAYKRGKEEAKE